MFPILSYLIFLPVIGALLILLISKEKTALIRNIALLFTAAVLVLSFLLIAKFDFTQTHMQFMESAPWIYSFHISYLLGVDGISVALVFLTALLGFIACLASAGIHKNQKEYYVFYLLLMTGMMGTFLALDLFLFYIFWEVVLIPMYFLVGIWGGPRRQYAATKFFLYTLAGSVVMLMGILVTYFTVEPHTFNWLIIREAAPTFSTSLQIFLFLSFYLAFAVKVPVFPFHTWLPDAHVEAPTPISVLLAGVLLKMGGYGLFRICYPLFPQAAHHFAYFFAVLGTINIVYGASVAMAQTDFKKMVAYSSVSHMGFVMLGLASLTSVGLNGALLEMFNHGIITGGMFLLVGVVYDRAHTRDLDRFGGLSTQMPKYAFFLTLFTLASLGLPGLSGFVGEFMSLIGAFGSFHMFTIISTIGLIVTVIFSLGIIKRVLLGKINPHVANFKDLSQREWVTLVPLMILAVIVGVYPTLILQYQEAAVEFLLKMM